MTYNAGQRFLSARPYFFLIESAKASAKGSLGLESEAPDKKHKLYRKCWPRPPPSSTLRPPS